MTNEQLGFGFDQMLEEERLRHLPATTEGAIPYYRNLVDRNHAAVMAGDETSIATVREEAYDLALKLNGGNPGVLAGPNAPGSMLERSAAAPKGDVPLWGQSGDYIIRVGSMEVRIEQDGLFGIGCRYAVWPSFAAHAVHRNRPFISGTGYRSFVGAPSISNYGVAPDEFVRLVIQRYIDGELHGKLVLPKGVVEDRPGEPSSPGSSYDI